MATANAGVDFGSSGKTSVPSSPGIPAGSVGSSSQGGGCGCESECGDGASCGCCSEIDVDLEDVYLGWNGDWPIGSLSAAAEVLVDTAGDSGVAFALPIQRDATAPEFGAVGRSIRDPAQDLAQSSEESGGYISDTVIDNRGCSASCAASDFVWESEQEAAAAGVAIGYAGSGVGGTNDPVSQAGGDENTSSVVTLKCGPDVTKSLVDLLNDLSSRWHKSGVGLGRAKDLLGDPEYDFKGKAKTPDCPKGEPCQETVTLCRQCVSDSVPGNIIYGHLISNLDSYLGMMADSLCSVLSILGSGNEHSPNQENQPDPFGSGHMGAFARMGSEAAAHGDRRKKEGGDPGFFTFCWDFVSSGVVDSNDAPTFDSSDDQSAVTIGAEFGGSGSVDRAKLCEAVKKKVRSFKLSTKPECPRCKTKFTYATPSKP